MNSPVLPGTKPYFQARCAALWLATSIMVASCSTTGPQVRPDFHNTDFRTMQPEEAMRALSNAQSIRVDIAAPEGPEVFNQKVCNGKRYDYSNMRGERACAPLSSDIGIPLVLARNMELLFRGCGVYAPTRDESWGDKRSGYTCGMLGSLFFAIGNTAAAKAVWEQAPGCHSYDINGNPNNGCVKFIVGWANTGVGQSWIGNYDARIAAFDSDRPQLITMARHACATEADAESCIFLQNSGEQINAAAAAAEQRRRIDAYLDTRHEQIAERAEASRAADSRFNTALGALQSMPGGSDPNAILNTGDQQAAAIRAIGDANAARQQQDTQVRLASQRATLPSTNQGSSIVAGPATPSQSSAQVVTSPTGAKSNIGNSNSSVASGAIQYSTPLATSCVRQFWDPNTYNWLSFENNCGQAIYVSIIPRVPGGWAMGGGMHLTPGSHNNTGLSTTDVNNAGGFGIYVCPTDSVPVDLNGNVLNANVSEYRCKPQQT
jgi:hypothetical protein